MEGEMGTEDRYRDASARQQHEEAFRLAVEILGRKCSKNLMFVWVQEAVKCLWALDRLDLLPDCWEKLSVYGQRLELEKIKL
jgi:hypothetical protein